MPGVLRMGEYKRWQTFTHCWANQGRECVVDERQAPCSSSTPNPGPGPEPPPELKFHPPKGYYVSNYKPLC